MGAVQHEVSCARCGEAALISDEDHMLIGSCSIIRLHTTDVYASGSTACDDNCPENGLWTPKDSRHLGKVRLAWPWLWDHVRPG